MKPPTKKQIKESEEQRIQELLKAQEQKQKDQNEDIDVEIGIR